MPGVMPGNISQGYLLQAMRDYFNDSDTTADMLDDLKALLNDTQVNQPLHQILETTLTGYSSDPKPNGFQFDINHFEADWCPEPKKTGEGVRVYRNRLRRAWWLDHQPIDQIIREGLITLIEEKKKDMTNCWFDVYWICAGSSFEVDILDHVEFYEADEGEEPEVAINHKTLLFLTPRPPISRRRRDGYDGAGTSTPKIEGIWVHRGKGIKFLEQPKTTKRQDTERVRPKKW